MTVKVLGRRVKVNHIRIRNDGKEVWEVTTVRGRWLGTFSCRNTQQNWDQNVAQIIKETK